MHAVALPPVTIVGQDICSVAAGALGGPVIDVDDQQYTADDHSASDETRRATATWNQTTAHLHRLHHFVISANVAQAAILSLTCCHNKSGPRVIWEMVPSTV